MTELNFLAKPFVPKLQKSFTEEDFIELKKELENERDKCIKYEKEKLKILHEIKNYVANVEDRRKNFLTSLLTSREKEKPSKNTKYPYKSMV